MPYKSEKKLDYFKFCGILINSHRAISAEICNRVRPPSWLDPREGCIFQGVLI